MTPEESDGILYLLVHILFEAAYLIVFFIQGFIENSAAYVDQWTQTVLSSMSDNRSIQLFYIGFVKLLYVINLVVFCKHLFGLENVSIYTIVGYFVALFGYRYFLSQYMKEVLVPSSGTVEKDSVCVICRDKSKTILILPCRHMCTCRRCAEALWGKKLKNFRESSCPQCWSNISQIIQINQ